MLGWKCGWEGKWKVPVEEERVGGGAVAVQEVQPRRMEVMFSSGEGREEVVVEEEGEITCLRLGGLELLTLGSGEV